MKFLKELQNIIIEQECIDNDCELVYVDDEDNVLSEAAVAAFQRKGTKIKKTFRCASGDKKGRLVANPATCTARKNPKRMMAGRRIQQAVKGIRIRKAKIQLRRNTSKMVRKMNKRLKKSSTRGHQRRAA